MLGTHIASSPLLAEAWRQSVAADAAGGESFLARQADGVVYVAFSGFPILSLMASSPGAGFFRAVPISGSGSSAGELFSQLVGNGEGGEPVLVHAATLHCFLTAYNTPAFQALLVEIQDRGHNGLVLTGRSAGGTVAALAALSFLCLSRSSTSPSPASLSSVLCVNFGSSLLGNEPFARAVLREGWGGRFCHVVCGGDALPRVLFCPADSIAPELVAHLLLTHSGPPCSAQISSCSTAGAELRSFISAHMRALSSSQQASPVLAHQSSFYRPFGSYLFCSAQGGAVCVDNPHAIMKMMYLTFAMDSHVEKEILSYGDLMDRICRRSLLKVSTMHEELRATSSHEAGILLAMEASGIKHHDMGAREAEECLRAASTIERIPSLNCAHLARKLAVVTPYRAQIEWYKSSCDVHMGYYDAFKHRGASKKEAHVNMNRMRLAQFWDDVLDMLEKNHLPHDFSRRHKWVNASQFYKLLVEPLDIAEYYRNKKHRTVGHYLTHGRERRYRVFDQWWSDKAKQIGREGMDGKRSRFAGLTQDSCFWARVEEARETAERAIEERDPLVLRRLWDHMNAFDRYAMQLIERKEVSIDVLAERSSYRLWQGEWKRLKSGNL